MSDVGKNIFPPQISEERKLSFELDKKIKQLNELKSMLYNSALVDSNNSTNIQNEILKGIKNSATTIQYLAERLSKLSTASTYVSK